MNFNQANNWSFEDRLATFPQQKIAMMETTRGGSPSFSRTRARSESMQAVDLTNNKDLDAADIIAIVKHTDNLTSLALENCANVTDEVVEAVVKSSRVLTTLNIAHNYAVTDAAIHSIATYDVMLTTLRLDGCFQVSRFGIYELVEKCRSLTRLDITLSEDIDSSILEVIAEINPKVVVNLRCKV
eukprot:gene27936-34722_t